MPGEVPRNRTFDLPRMSNHQATEAVKDEQVKSVVLYSRDKENNLPVCIV